MYVCMYVCVCYRSGFFHFTNSLGMIQGIHSILVQASRHRSCAMCARFVKASRLDRWIGVLWENLWETMENPWKTMENHWKPWENHGKTMGKPWENHGKPWKTHGKPCFFTNDYGVFPVVFSPETNPMSKIWWQAWRVYVSLCMVRLSYWNVLEYVWGLRQNYPKNLVHSQNFPNDGWGFYSRTRNFGLGCQSWSCHLLRQHSVQSWAKPNVLNHPQSTFMTLGHCVYP